MADPILPDPLLPPDVPSGEQQRVAFPASERSRWRQGALHAQPQILQRTTGWDGCGPFLSECLRCITWNTRFLVGSVFSRQRNRESKLNYLNKLLDHNNIICLQELHGKDELLQAIQVLAPRFLLFGTVLPDSEAAGGSAICIHRDLLVTHVVTCQGRDHLVNIRSGRHSLVFVNVHFEPELTLRQLRGRLCLIHPHWPAFPVVWFFLAILTYVIRKKDDLMFVTKHSPMATRVRRLCSILSFHTSLRLPNLITPGETPQPLVSYALCQGLIVFFQFTYGSSHVVENLWKQTVPSDHAAVRLVIQKPTNRRHQSKRIHSWMSKYPIFVSILQQLYDDHSFSLTHFVHWPNLKFSYIKPRRLRNESYRSKHLTASGQSF